MFVVLAVVGLVIDGGLAYLLKARLCAAVDSAALAGARAVLAGDNQTEQIASARAAAADFFAANIPSSYLLSKPTLLSTEVTFQTGRGHDRRARRGADAGIGDAGDGFFILDPHGLRPDHPARS